MKHVVAVLLGCLLCAKIYTQPALQKQGMVMKRVIEKNHYAPKPINDSFSVHVFNAIIDELDKYKLYFTEENMKRLRPFSDKIDDELNGKSWGFADALVKEYRLAVSKADSSFKFLLQQPIDISTTDYYTCVLKQTRAENNTQLTARQKIYSKWLLLNALMDEAEEQNTKPGKDCIAINKVNIQKKIA